MSEPRNIRLVLSYDGTDFHGWQRQEGARSVQQELEKALERLHKKPVTVHVAGRTDSGVHARAQVVHFHTDIASIPAQKFIPALNALLDRDVRVLRAEEASADFHARFDAKNRSYRYQIIAGRSALPYELRYAWQLWHTPQLSRLNEMASALLGEIDCSTFATPQDPSESRHRYISEARFMLDGGYLVFEIRANAFLWRMVRSIVGSLIHYERNGCDAAGFAAVVASRDRRLAGPTAPAQGLFLWDVEYFRL